MNSKLVVKIISNVVLCIGTIVTEQLTTRKMRKIAKEEIENYFNEYPEERP